MVHFNNAIHTRHTWICFITIQCKAVRGSSGIVETSAEAIRGEEAIGIVELKNTTHHIDGLLIGIELTIRIECGIGVVKGGGGCGIAITGGKVNGNHEVEIESVLYELQESGFGDEFKGANEQRAVSEEAMMLSPVARTAGQT